MNGQLEKTREIPSIIIETSIDKLNEEDIVCDSCLDGEVYNDNAIIICEKCHVPVHQLCYGVTTVPSGPWLCYVCSSGLDPQRVTCELCSNVGGAYKICDRPGKWAHSICAMWIPEIFETQSSNLRVPILNASHLDKKRFKLKCAICPNRGACIQCCYGRCAVGAHPWCVMRTPKGFTHRIIKNDDGLPVWEIFCKTHAKSVTEPIKPKFKSKYSVPIPLDDSLHQADDDVNLSYWNTNTTTHKNGTKRDDGQDEDFVLNKKKKNQAPSMSHAQQFDNNLLAKNESANHPRNPSNKNKLSSKIPVVFNRPGKSSAVVERNSLQLEPEIPTASTSFPLLNMLEWPGQSEGEAMDLDHFWNVTSTFFPESHNAEWLKVMLGVEDTVEANLRTSDPIYSLSKSDEPQDRSTLEESAEELLQSIGGERERSIVFDFVKREQSLLRLQRRLVELTASSHLVGDSTNLVSSVPYRSNHFYDITKEANQQSVVKEDLKVAPIHHQTSFQANKVPFFTSENDFYTNNYEFLSKKNETQSDEEGINYKSSTIHVVFDGKQRQSIQFKIDSNKQTPLLIEEADHSLRQFHDMNIIASEAVRSSNQSMETLDGLHSIEQPLSTLTVSNTFPALTIQSNLDYPPHEEVPLSDGRSVISRNEDDALSRIIRTDQLALFQTSMVIRNELKNLSKQFDIIGRSNLYVDKLKEWRVIEERYLKQHIWKNVSLSLAKGIRDQGVDFNKHESEQLPASWVIQVDGRPTAPAMDTEMGDEEPIEDAICMCCFDGTSSEGNRILFCDGCNATMHQRCYGVDEIPEGDFYCDRCIHVQTLADEMGFDSRIEEDTISLSTAVMCCLCPLHHGGIKPTTDGRWVHICCAIWSKTAVITDLNEMGPIDVTNVITQYPKGNLNSFQSKVTNMVEAVDNPVLCDPCMFCRAYGGLIQRCCFNSDDKSSCDNVFHPICAWFEGLHFHVRINDPTFQGLERDGLYPSGLTFDILCLKHSDAHRRNLNGLVTIGTRNSTHEQRALRKKYKIKREDLENIPGNNRRRNKKKPKKPKEISSSTRMNLHSVGRPIKKELNPDIYDDKICGICLEPVSNNVFCLDRKDLEEISKDGNFSIINQMFRIKLTCTGCSITVHCDCQKILYSDHVQGNFESPDWLCELCSTKDAIKKMIEYHKSCIAETTQSTNLTSKPAPLTIESEESNTHGLSSSSENPVDVNLSAGAVEPSQPNDEQSLALLSGTLRRLDTVHCNLCPRKGGFLVRSNDTSIVEWIHLYCAMHSTGQMKINFGQPMEKKSKQNVKVNEISSNFIVNSIDQKAETKAFHTESNQLNIGQDDPLPVITTQNRAEDSSSPSVLVSKSDATMSQSPSQPKQPAISYKGSGAIVEVRAIPKENRKEKCVICNRKQGVTACCYWIGCASHFHPICGARNGKFYVCTRQGEAVSYCSEHIPDGVEKLPSGYWVDGHEIYRLRYSLDRARLLLDVLLRREKLKKLFHKTDLEAFTIKFNHVLDKANGRPPSKLFEEEDFAVTDRGLYEESDMIGEDDIGQTVHSGKQVMEYFMIPETDGSSSGKRKENNEYITAIRQHKKSLFDDFVPINFVRPKGIDSMVQLFEEGDVMKVSGRWNDANGDIKLPRKVIVAFAGEEVTLSDTILHDDKAAYMTESREKLQDIVALSRPVVGIFKNEEEAVKFSNELVPYITRHVDMDDEDFSREMATQFKIKVKLLPEKVLVEQPMTAKKVKKGYAILSEDDELDGRLDGRKKSKNGEMKKGRSVKEWASPVVLASPDQKKRGRPKSILVEEESFDVKEGEDPVPLLPLSSSKRGSRQSVGSNAAATPSAVSETKLSKKDRLKIQLASASKEKSEVIHKSSNGKRSRQDLEDVKKVDLHSKSSHEISATARSSSRHAKVRSKKDETASELDPCFEQIKLSYTLIKSQSPETTSLISNGFDDVFHSVVGLDQWTLSQINQTEAAADEDNPWFMYDASRLHRLERRIFDVLLLIEQTEVPSQHNEIEVKVKKNQKKITHYEEMEGLADEFQSIPEEDIIPFYASYVRRPLILPILHERLQRHEYCCWAAFEKDFYEMLNNGRNVTKPHSLTWNNTQKLAELYEDAKIRYKYESYRSIHGSVSQTKQKEVVRSCDCCHLQFKVLNWPKDFHYEASTSTEESNALREWQWLCKDCVERSSIRQILLLHPPPGAVQPANEKVVKYLSRHQVPYEVVGLSQSQSSNGLSDPLYASSQTSTSTSTTHETFQSFPTIDKLMQSAFTTDPHLPPPPADDDQVDQSLHLPTPSVEMIGKDVLVWWRDDRSAYKAKIELIDEVSLSYRVHYELDQKWEYLNLINEPFLISNPSYVTSSSSSTSKMNQSSKKRKHSASTQQNGNNKNEMSESIKRYSMMSGI